MVVALHSSLGRIVLGRTVISIGRAPQNTIAVANDVSVSMRHAEVRPDSQGYVLVDVGSKNGTYLNGKRLQPYEPMRLKVGDFLYIGVTGFSVGMEDSPSLDATIVLHDPGPPSLLSRFSQHSNRDVIKASAIALIIAAGMMDVSMPGLSIVTLAAILNAAVLILIFFI